LEILKKLNKFIKVTEVLSAILGEI
jgi:hypothetical protein